MAVVALIIVAVAIMISEHSWNALYSAPGALLRALHGLSSPSLLTTCEIVGMPPSLAGQTDLILLGNFLTSSIKAMATGVHGK